MAQIASAILYNGQAGLIDLDITQQQKVLGAYGGYSGQPDYSTFLVGGSPKAGQTLEEVRDLLLAEVAKLRSGDFDEKLIEASINNFKLYQMRAYEDNDSRADMYVQSFIAGTNWADEVAQLDRMSKITKQDASTGPTSTSARRATPSSSSARARTRAYRKSPLRKSPRLSPTATSRAPSSRKSSSRR